MLHVSGVPRLSSSSDRYEAVTDADVIMTLRIQKERLSEELFKVIVSTPGHSESTRSFSSQPSQIAL